MSIGYDNRPNLNSERFEQTSGDTLNLCGCTTIIGASGKINSNSGYQISGNTVFAARGAVVPNSVQIGYNANSLGNASTAIGFGAQAIGDKSVAIGCGNVSCAIDADVIGGNNNLICSGNTNSTFIGYNACTIAPDTYQNTVAVPSLAITTTPAGTGTILGWDVTTKKICLTQGAGDALTGYTCSNTTALGINTASYQGTTCNISFGSNVMPNAISSAINNVGIGTSALRNLSSGDCNIAIGTDALYSATTTTNNVAIGRGSMCSITTTSSYGNVGIGTNTLCSATSALGSVAIGVNVLWKTTEGDYNIGIGANVLCDNTTGSNNIAMGYCALPKNVIGSSNIALGVGALCSNTGGTYNVAIGGNSLRQNTSGINNVAVGGSVLVTNTIGQDNIGIGYGALSTNITGSDNIALGCSSMVNFTTGCLNIALGCFAMRGTSAAGGKCNIGLGYQSLYNITTGCDNIALGYSSLYGNLGGNCNIALGNTALRCNTTGTDNIGIGDEALLNNITGSRNIGIGRFVLNYSKTGSDNIAMGNAAMLNNIDAGRNVAIGYSTLSNLTGGTYTVAIGGYAGYSNVSGETNVFIGCAAGYNETGSNRLHIANSSSSSLIYGEFDTKLVCIDNKLSTCQFQMTCNAASGCVLTSDASGNATWATGGGGGTASGENVTKEVTQATHGFAVMDFVGWSGGTYTKAIANGSYDGEFVGLVTVSADTDNFSVTQSGYVTGLTSLTANATYFLSDVTAGLLNPVAPTTEGSIYKAVLIANSTTTGWVLPYVGNIITSGGTGGGASGERISKIITQNSHGFAVNDVVGFSGTTYNKAIADGSYDGEFLGLVTASANTNTFELTQAGYVEGLSSLVTNTTYFLSDVTAGLLTSVEPTTVGSIYKSVLFANSETSGWVLPYVGNIITSGGTGGGGGIAMSGSTANGLTTYVDVNTICAQPNLIFDGSKLQFGKGAIRCITVAPQDGALTGEDDLYIIGQQRTASGSENNAGNVLIRGGLGNITTPSYGGHVVVCGGIGCGGTASVGGGITILGGLGCATGTGGGEGGDVVVCGGDGCVAAGTSIGGDVKIYSGVGVGGGATHGCVSLFHGTTERLKTTTTGVCIIGVGVASTCFSSPTIYGSTLVCGATVCATTGVNVTGNITFAATTARYVCVVSSTVPASLVVSAGDSTTTVKGGNLYLRSGNNDSTGEAGDIHICGGIGIEDSGGHIYICSGNGDGDGCVMLYHDTTKVLNTTSTGIYTTGTHYASVCLCSPVVCATTCFESAVVCATTAFRSTGAGYRYCGGTGCGTAVDWVATSDCRLKDNFIPISSALSKVNCLCGWCYDFCEDGTADMGLVAQEVQKVEPRLVAHGDIPEEYKKYGIEDEVLSLKYDKFAGLFVEAIKELKTQNEGLQNQITELQNEINRIKN